MSDLTSAAVTWLAAHHGVITTAQLRDCDVSKRTIQRLVAAGVLRESTRGVFIAASTSGTLEQRCAAMTAAHPQGFVTGPTAGMLAKLRRMPPSAALHFSLPHGVHMPPISGVTWRQTTAISKVDRRARGDGITVASWARLAFDLAADLGPLDHLSVVNQLLHEQPVTVDELWAIDRRLGHPARPGSGRFRRTLEMLGGAAQQSHPEVVLGDALRRCGVPVEAQTAIRLVGGRVVHVDLGVSCARWGIELDIHPEHRTVEGHAADAARRRDMARAGWQVETVTEHDMRHPESVAAELAALYTMRAREHRVHPSVEGAISRPPTLR
jgi:hypothetical protein